MPSLPPAASPYPTIQSILDAVRVRSNDAGIDIAGSIFSNDQPYVETYLNLAYEWLQEMCAINDIETEIGSADIFGLPPASSPSAVCSISWTGTFDGANYRSGPALPQDMILPMDVYIRQTGTLNAFMPFHQAKNGLPNVPQNGYAPYVYDWRGDAMWFIGQSTGIDMRVRYARALQDLSISNPMVQVPIMFCKNALASKISALFEGDRGGVNAPKMEQEATDAFNRMATRTAQRKGSVTYRRKPYSRRRRRGVAAPYIHN